MTKILKKSLACLLVFALCFTAIAGCLAVSAEKPVASISYDVMELSNDNKEWQLCPGETVRGYVQVNGIKANTTVGIKLELPKHAEITKVHPFGTADGQEIKRYFDAEESILTIIFKVAKDGYWNHLVYFNVTDATPKGVVYYDCTVDAAIKSNDSDDDHYINTVTRHFEVKAHEAAAPVHENIVEATCTTDGSYDEVVYCKWGDNEEISRNTVTVDALGHAWDEGKVDPDATCTTDGVITYTCKNDPSHTKTEAISKKDHTPAADLVDNKDGTHSEVCDVCGAKLSTAEHDFAEGDCACGAKKPAEGPVEIEVDNNITFKDFKVSIGACLEMKIRVTTNTIDMNKYASYDLVVVPTKYDRTLGNAYNEIVLEPIVLKNEPTASYSVYKYTDIAMYELGLTMDVYVRCYDANKNIIATSAIQTVSAEQKLMEEYVKTSATEKLKNVVADLLEMGAKAQIYFGYRNKNSKLYADLTDPNKNILVNKGINRDDLTENYAELPDGVAADWNAESTITAATNRLSTGLSADKAPIPTFTIYKGTSLVRSDIELHVVYTSNKGTEYDFKVSGEDLRVSGTKLIYDCDVLAYYDTNVNVSVTFTYAGTRVWTQEYSVETGVKANLASTDADLASLVDAIAKFGVSARNYTGYGV